MTGTPEFSRPIALDTIGAGASGVAIEANAGERAALARRFDLVALESLTAEAEVRRSGDLIRATGRIAADVVQACVVTGDPVPAHIDEAFDIAFVAEGGAFGEEEIELSEAECETVFYEGGAIDLGEAAAQTMALALDPFPRGEGADAALREAGVLSEEDAGPFGALGALRDKMTEKTEDPEGRS